MSQLDSLEALLSQYELYEPELGQRLKSSPHILTLGLGRSRLAAWETAPLTYLYGASNQTTYATIVRALRLSEALQTALLRREQSGRYDYYWNWDPAERVDHLRLEGPELEIGFANRRGHHRLQVRMPALGGPERAAALAWLSEAATLDGIAQGQPLAPEALERFRLVPAWEVCEVAASTKSREALEAGLQFLCRALVVFPAYLPILRGLGGETALRQCATREIAGRQADFEAAAASLPAGPAEFWAGGALPDLPAPHEVAPEPGLGVFLPPADFWPKPEDNRLFAEALAKVYKNVPRKLARLTEPRRLY